MASVRRSVPGAQGSFLNARTQRCPTCKGEGHVPRPPQVRPVFTLEEACALLERRGPSLDQAQVRLAEAVDRARERQSEGDVTCATCGGTGKVTILPRR